MTTPANGNKPLTDDEFFGQFPKARKRRNVVTDVALQIPLSLAEGLQRFANTIGGLNISQPTLLPPPNQPPVLDEIIKQTTTVDPTPDTNIGRIVREGGASAVEAIPYSLGGGIAPAIAAGLGGAVDQGAEELGLPPWLGKSGRFITSVNPFNLFRNIFRGISSGNVSSSGLPVRKFQTQTKPTNVSGKTLKNINTALEEDFRGISNQILDKSKTVRDVNEIPEFAEIVGNEFQNVENLAKRVPGTFSTKGLSRELSVAAESKVGKTITPNEYQKSYKKFYNEIQKEISHEPYVKNRKTIFPEPLDISAEKLVKQYRDNNKALTKYFESGKSGAYNDGKRDALLDYNKAIENVINKRYPNSEFSKLFRFTNDRWSEIKSYDSVKNVLDQTFSGDKINFNVLEKSMKSPNFTQNIERLVGKEGVNNFKELSKDFLTRRQSYQLLKQAESQGFNKKDLATAAAYIANPTLGKLAGALSVGSRVYKKIYQSSFTNPTYTKDWRKALQLFKQGKYGQAIPIFNRLSKEEPEEVSLEDFLAD